MISGISLICGGQMTIPIVFPACLLAGIQRFGLKGESWIPERVREDHKGSGAMTYPRLSGTLVGRNLLFV